MATLVVIMLWGLLILAIGVVLNLVVQWSVHLWRVDKIVVGEFFDNGQAKTEYASKFRDRWRNFSIGGSELEKAGTDLPFSTGGDFLFAEIEQKTAEELAKDFDELAKDVDLKIAGVSVGGFAKFLDSITHRSLRKVEGRLSRCGNEMTLTVTLGRGSKTEKVWSSSKTVAFR